MYFVRKAFCTAWICMLLLTCSAAADSIVLTGNTLSATGNLKGAPPENGVALIDFTLLNPSDVLIQTFSYGGGTNSASATIPSGGFLPEIAVYGPSGSLVLDSGINNLVSSDPLGGCDISGQPTTKVSPSASSGFCGDVVMDSSQKLGSGDYILAVLATGNAPAGLTFAAGFTGGGSFTDVNGSMLSSAYAVDVTANGLQTSPLPEPSALLLLGTGLGLLGAIRFSRGDANAH